MASLDLSICHVHPHRPSLRLYHLCLRRHQQRRRSSPVQQRLQGVQAGRLLQLAAESRQQQQKLEQNQELLGGRQGLYRIQR